MLVITYDLSLLETSFPAANQSNIPSIYPPFADGDASDATDNALEGYLDLSAPWILQSLSRPGLRIH